MVSFKYKVKVLNALFKTVTLKVLFRVLKAYPVLIFDALIIYKKFICKSLTNVTLMFVSLDVNYLYFLCILTKSFLFLKYRDSVN